MLIQTYRLIGDSSLDLDVKILTNTFFQVKPVNYETVQELPYLDMVFCETSRLASIGHMWVFYCYLFRNVNISPSVQYKYDLKLITVTEAASKFCYINGVQEYRLMHWPNSKCVLIAHETCPLIWVFIN